MRTRRKTYDPVVVSVKRRASRGQRERAVIEKPTNPLLVDLILDQIFHEIIDPIRGAATAGNHEVVKDIVANVKNLRLVCKLWWDRSTRIFKELRPPIVFEDSDDDEDSGGESAPTPGVSLMKRLHQMYSKSERFERFLKTMKSSQMIPASEYTLRGSMLESRNESLVHDFLEICGPEAVILNLQFTQFQNFDVKWSASELNLANLKVLTVYMDDFTSCNVEPTEDQYSDTGSFIGLILKAAHNLWEFHLHSGRAPIWGWSSHEHLFSLIPSSVKAIDVFLPNLSDVYLKVLIEKKVKLIYCKFIAQDDKIKCSEEVVREFFEMQKDTLENLIWPTSRQSLLADRFPPLKELKELTLLSDMMAKDVVPLHFPSTFPKLEMLNLRNFCEAGSHSQLLVSTAPAPSLKKIVLPFTFQFSWHHGMYLQAEFIRQIAKCFPKLKIIHTVHGRPSEDAALHQLITCFPQLEELEIDFTGHVNSALGRTVKQHGDAILSGLSEYDCRMIRSRGNSANVNMKGLQQSPTILQLKNLKKLALKNCFVKFTDLSVYQVFLKMEKLEQLHVDDMFMSNFNPDYISDISSNAMAMLITKLDVFEDDRYLVIDNGDEGNEEQDMEVGDSDSEGNSE